MFAQVYKPPATSLRTLGKEAPRPTPSGYISGSCLMG